MSRMQRQARRILPSFFIFALVVLTLEAQSIWWDEGISLHLATLPWRAVLADRAANIHPPLYFLLLRGWGVLAGLSPFSGRFLSALAVTLLPACASRFVGRRSGRRAGRAAGLLVAVAPPFIIYGQEVRAYALLPLGVLGLWALAWPVGAPEPADRLKPQEALRANLARAAVLGLVQAALLLTHYAGALACAMAALAYGLRAFRAPKGPHRRYVVREWFSGLLVAVILVLPWALVVARTGLTGMAGQAGLANVTGAPVAAGYVAGLLGVFHTTGLPAALGDRALLGPTVIAGFLLFVGIVMHLVRAGQRGLVGALLALWLVPFAAAPLIWFLSPQSHPRYLFGYIVGGWLTAALVISSRDVHRLVRGALLAALLVTGLLSTCAYLTQPAYARSDVRAVAAFLREEADAGDVVIVPSTDWSLLQYDLGRTKAVMAPPFAVWEREVAGLVARLGEAERVYVLDYGRGAVDPGGALRVVLTQSGVLVERHDFTGVFVEVYEVLDAVRGVIWRAQEPVCVASGPLCLEASAFPATPVSGAALPVALQWRGGSPDARYGVALRLFDPSGALVAAAADELVDATLAPTSLWHGARSVSSYHVVPLPVGLLPLPYRLEAGIFDRDDPGRPVAIHTAGGPSALSVVLGDVVARIEPWRDHSMYGLVELPTVTGEAGTASPRLEAAAVDRALARPGEVIFVSTLWRVAAQPVAPLDAAILLRSDGTILATAPLRVSDAGLPPGRPLLHLAALTVPASAPAGMASIGVDLAGHLLDFGDVMVDAAEHFYEPPPIRYPVVARAGDIATLVGFDLVPATVAGAPFTVTLQWRAESGAAAADLKVFTHLVVGGQIVAQHDAVPANWSRPTPGWLTGEIVVDSHALAWQTAEVTGEGVLCVGLYHPATGERVIWADGEDRFALPVVISVELAE